MSLYHKAFIFESDEFYKEFQPIWEKSSEKDASLIKDFIEKNKEEIKDPYEGEEIDDDWEDMIDDKDVHQYGDFAITKYYSPAEEQGLGSDWYKLSEFLISRLRADVSPVLGIPLTSGGIEFDPGKMGSYFQTKQDVADNLEKISKLADIPEELKDLFEQFKSILENAKNEGKGLYVTF